MKTFRGIVTRSWIRSVIPFAQLLGMSRSRVRSFNIAFREKFLIVANPSAAWSVGVGKRDQCLGSIRKHRDIRAHQNGLVACSGDFQG